MSERGQSEVLGFVAVFGLIVLTITFISATGFAGLENEQEFAQTNNAQRALTVLADNVDDVTRDGATSRTTAIKLAETTLSLTETTTITVSGERTANASENFTRSYTLHPITYDSGSESRIAYSAGALIRENRDGEVMVRQPDFVLTEDTVVIPIVRTYPVETREMGGSTTARIRTVARDRKVVRTNRTEYEITLSVTTPRPAAWQRYLESHSATSCSRSGDTVSCTITTRHVAVAITEVAVSFD